MTDYHEPGTTSASFLLVAPTLPAGVEVSVRAKSGRWVSEASWAGRTQLGVGATPRDALAAALSPLGRQAIVELLASPEAFALSVRFAEARQQREAR